jgi:hypothetical protein
MHRRGVSVWLTRLSARHAGGGREKYPAVLGLRSVALERCSLGLGQRHGGLTLKGRTPPQLSHLAGFRRESGAVTQTDRGFARSRPVSGQAPERSQIFSLSRRKRESGNVVVPTQSGAGLPTPQ